MTLTIIPAIHKHAMNICGRFYRNPSTSKEIRWHHWK